MECDPKPPFNAGNVEGVGEAIAMAALGVLMPVAEGTMAALGERIDL